MADRIREFQEKTRSIHKNEPEDTRPDTELSIDELAARELLRGDHSIKYLDSEIFKVVKCHNVLPPQSIPYIILDLK